MDKKIIKKNLYYLIVSIIILCVAFLIGPLLETMQSNETIVKIISFLICTTILLVYGYILKSFKPFKTLNNFKYFNFLNYPLSILNCSILAMLGIASIVPDEHGAALGMIFGLFVLLPVFLATLVVMVLGIVQDIKSWREYIKAKKNNQL